MNSEAKRWRFWLLAAVAVSAVIWFFSTFIGTPLLPHWATTNGFAIEYESATASVRILSVVPGGPAARSGMRAGDRIYLSEIPLRERWRLHQAFNDVPFALGEHLRYLVHRGSRKLIAVLTPAPVVDWGGWSDWVNWAAFLWALLFAALLALRRPDSMHARLLSLILICVFAANPLTVIPTPWLQLDVALWPVGSILAFAGPIVLFAIFCASIARPLSRLRLTFAWSSVVLQVVSESLAIAWVVLFFIIAKPAAVTDLPNDYSEALSYLFSLACGVAAIRAATGADRQRIFWVTLSIAPMWLWFGVVNALYAFVPDQVLRGFFYFYSLSRFAMPVGLTYAVLSRRCVDVGYVFNRTVIFGGVSIVVLGVFVLLEWALSRWFTDIGRTAGIAVNLGVALALGVSIQIIHKRVEYFVDRVFFRRRHEDETALRRFAHEATYITDAKTLLSRTVDMVVRHTQARDVAVIFANEEIANDPAILAMRTWREPVLLHRYETSIDGELALPMIVRGNLLAVLVCGPKTTGEAYAPDECEALATLAHAVGSSLDRLAAQPADGQQRMVEVQAQILEELRAISGALMRLELRNNVETP